MESALFLGSVIITMNRQLVSPLKTPNSSNNTSQGKWRSHRHALLKHCTGMRAWGGGRKHKREVKAESRGPGGDIKTGAESTGLESHSRQQGPDPY
jgi:hypothetical protein